MLVHSAWLLAGIAIMLAACSAADDAALRAAPEATNIAHATPQPNAASGNVQDLTY
jgi:hypothetical protein